LCTASGAIVDGTACDTGTLAVKYPQLQKKATAEQSLLS